MVKKKIAIAGKAKSGKNTLADLLGQESKLKYQVFAFADPIKEMVMQMWPNTNRNVLWGPSELRSLYVPDSDDKICFRDVIVDLGTYGRSIYNNIWVNSTLNKIYPLLEEDLELAIISDVRYMNEYNKIKDDFITIRIIRTNNEYTYDHDSEKDLDVVDNSEFDYVVYNDSDIDSLKENCKILLQEILK